MDLIVANKQQSAEKLMAKTFHEDSPLAPTISPIPPNDRRRARPAGYPTRRVSPLVGDMAARTRTRPPFECIALLLQGGGALGAYQAGVYEALAEADIHPDWIAGISIGAINGALIAGNLPGERVEKLREFWETITQPGTRFPNVSWISDLTWNGNGQARHWRNRMSAFATMFQGVPNFFSPRAFPPMNAEAESPELVSYYDPSPLGKTLARLINFDLINSKPMRLSVGATNVRTGAPIYFENNERTITAAHVIASASLPPSFPPTEIDGRMVLGRRRRFKLADAIRRRQSPA